MTIKEAKDDYNIYKKIFTELEEKKIDQKKINKKIKVAYTSVHNRFLKKYNENEYYPVIFRLGNYNCVSASMIYSLVFDELKIPYKVMASSDHVYLIANPGANSVVVETTNPSFEKAIFNGEYKRQYAYYLKDSKIISEDDYKNKSIDEIFEENFNRVREAEFRNLPGFQYYNKSLTKLRKNEVEEGYQLCQKAYYFYPDQQVKALLQTALLLQIEKCKFDKVSDIDYLAQFTRFENTESEAVIIMFNNIIANKLQYTNKEAYCESLYNRLVSQIQDQKLKDKISFSFNLQMSYRYQKTNKVEKYVVNALKIKGNHRDANIMLSNHIQRKLSLISNSMVLLDTISQFEKRFDFSETSQNLKDFKLIAYLKIANDSFYEKKTTTGEKYLQLFENNCTLPIENVLLNNIIENTYASIARNYYYRNYKTKARSIISRGLKYVPNSDIIKSAVR